MPNFTVQMIVHDIMEGAANEKEATEWATSLAKDIAKEFLVSVTVESVREA